MMNSTTSPKRLDRRVVRTRQLIADAFIDLLQQQDLERITVNRITDRAQINRVTFYLHYNDIPDLMEKLADQMVVDMTTMLAAKKQQNDIINPNLLFPILDYIAQHAKFYKTVLATTRIPIFTERFMKMLSDFTVAAIAQRGTNSITQYSSISPDVVTWYMTSAMFGTLIFWLQNDMPYSPAELARQMQFLMTINRHE